jgi:hypothetical protein
MASAVGKGVSLRTPVPEARSKACMSDKTRNVESATYLARLAGVVSASYLAQVVSPHYLYYSR